MPESTEPQKADEGASLRPPAKGRSARPSRESPEEGAASPAAVDQLVAVADGQQPGPIPSEDAEVLFIDDEEEPQDVQDEGWESLADQGADPAEVEARTREIEAAADPAPGQREVVVFPTSDMRDGEGVVLRFDSGVELRLAHGYGGAYRGALPAERLEDTFQVLRTPGHVPEVGFHGQHIPRRSAARIDEPFWVYPVAWQDRLPRGTFPTRSGLHEDLVIRRSSRVPGPRVVRVHLPDSYLREPERKFPVVYVLDGQNAFDASTSYGGVEWCLDDIALQLEAEGGPACILVGIDNGCERRMHEYSFCPPPPPPAPPRTSRSGKRPLEDLADPDARRGADEVEDDEGILSRKAVALQPPEPEPAPVSEDGGGAAEHLDFILAEVAPRIRAKYRVQAGPGSLVGSSMGGLFALWAAVARPGAFRSVASVSPSVWWAQQAVLRVPLGAGPRPRVWIDMGSRESKTMVLQFREACQRLTELGWREGRDLRSLLVKGGTHHESAWADRSSSILRYLLA